MPRSKTSRRHCCRDPRIDREAIKPTARFQNDLDADSLEVVDLIMSAEDTFDIEIPDDKAETLLTVGDLIAYIKTKQKAPKGPQASSPGGWRRLWCPWCARLAACQRDLWSLGGRAPLIQPDSRCRKVYRCPSVRLLWLR